jgi:hypothetical protein
MSEIVWRLDLADAEALAKFLAEALDNLYLEGSELEAQLTRWLAELQELRTQRARYDALLQPSMEVLLT